MIIINFSIPDKTNINSTVVKKHAKVHCIRIKRMNKK
jgi:hypothetical protein